MVKYGGMDIGAWPKAVGCGRAGRVASGLWPAAAVAATALLASGCIVSEAVFTRLEDEPFEVNPEDPFEITNRHLYEINSGLDEAVLKPVAIGYTKVTPDPVEDCIGNIFSNIGEPLRMLSHMLLLDGQAAVDSYSRFLVNTTMGGAGCVDAAESMGISKSDADLGIVARRYEVFDHEPPFLMLPLLGPSTLDETAGSLLGNRLIDPVRDRHILRRNEPSHRERSLYNPYVTDNESDKNGRSLLSGVHIRARLLNTTDILDAAALDPYSFQRDAYVQRRRAQAERLRRKEYPKLLYPYTLLYGSGAD